MKEVATRIHSLASCYENALTTVVRLEALPPEGIPSAPVFRESIKVALKNSLEQGKALGYLSEINQTAFFAVVAFLDESVLRLQNPSMAMWAQRPLQEELFGHNRAGEVFFDNLRGLLARGDSEDTADALEVYCLCLLLGFKGKYALGGSGFRTSGEIESLVRQARDKMGRIRGHALFLRPEPAPPEVRQAVTRDRWSRGLGLAVLCLLLLALLAYGGFWIALDFGVPKII